MVGVGDVKNQLEKQLGLGEKRKNETHRQEGF
jgi:hypothetical protein